MIECVAFRVYLACSGTAINKKKHCNNNVCCVLGEEKVSFVNGEVCDAKRYRACSRNGKDDTKSHFVHS